MVFPPKIKEKFLAVAASIDGKVPWGSGEAIKVYYNPQYESLLKANVHGITEDTSSGIQIVLGRMRSKDVFKSIVAEEIYHAADFTNQSLHRFMGPFDAWQGEVRAIQFVIDNRSLIGYSESRENDLKRHVKSYKSCLIDGAGSGYTCSRKFCTKRTFP